MMTLLTKREYEMVELTAFGLAQKEIANHLNISPNTVDVTIRHAKEKLQVQKSTELAAWYFINKYHISLDLSPVTRAILSLSFLTLMLFALIDGFNPERASRTARTASRTSQTRRASRRSETEPNFYLMTA